MRGSNKCPKCQLFAEESGHVCKPRAGAFGAALAPIPVLADTLLAPTPPATGNVDYGKQFEAFQAAMGEEQASASPLNMDPERIRTLQGDGKGSKEERRAAQEARREAIQEELAKGVEALSTSEGFKTFLDSMAQFRTYSWGNTLLIHVQRPDATRVASFNTWKGLGRSVKKGAKGIIIQRPLMVSVTETDANGNPILDAKGKPKKSQRIARDANGYPRFTTGHVFDVADTEGEPLPEPPAKPLKGEAPPGMVDKLESAVEAHGYSLSYEEIPLHGVNGYTSPETKSIVVDSRLSEAQRAKTLTHELAHAVLHADEDAGAYHNGAGGCRGQMEVEAEAVAYVISKEQGLDTSDYSFGYVTSWGSSRSADSKTPADSIRKYADTIQKGVREIATLLDAND